MLDDATTVDAAQIDDHGVARRLGVSRSFVRKLLSRGAIPRPNRLGRAVRWPIELIDRWIAAGCPKPEKWEGDNRE